MNRKWLEREGHQWVKDGLIQKEQLKMILDRYSHKPQKSMLPILASMLVGLGILTFIASNWEGIPQLIKLLLIIITMSSFYIIGNIKTNNGDTRLGHALTGIGIITYGAGIILVNQMFHLTFSNAITFILWTLGALCMLALYRSKFVFILTSLIILTGEIYSSNEYRSFSYILALLLLFGLGHFVYNRASKLFSTIFAFSFLLTGFLYFIDEHISYMWLSIFMLILIILSEAPNRKIPFKPLRVVGMITQVFLICFNIFALDNIRAYDVEQLPTISYFVMLAILFAIYLSMFFKKGNRYNLLYLLLFFPVFLLGDHADVIYILLMYLFSILSLIVGYQFQKSEFVDTGTFVFLISTIVGYVQLAWAFMPKSLFFLSGGILLFLLSWFLENRRRKWQKVNGGESH